MSESQRRCPTCGALASGDADWCGQCYSSLEPARAKPAAATPPALAQPSRAAWPCPVCGNRNPIELDACATCATPFGRGFDEPKPPPKISPREAAIWSLAFPGLGHLRCGRGVEGFGRAILFVWATGTTAILFASRSGKGGLGSIGPLLVLFVVAALVVYAMSALDAYRLAAGASAVVSSRALLWGATGLVLLSVVLGAIIAVGAVRSQ